MLSTAIAELSVGHEFMFEGSPARHKFYQERQLASSPFLNIRKVSGHRGHHYEAHNHSLSFEAGAGLLLPPLLSASHSHACRPLWLQE